MIEMISDRANKIKENIQAHFHRGDIGVVFALYFFFILYIVSRYVYSLEYPTEGGINVSFYGFLSLSLVASFVVLLVKNWEDSLRKVLFIIGAGILVSFTASFVLDIVFDIVIAVINFPYAVVFKAIVNFLFQVFQFVFSFVVIGGILYMAFKKQPTPSSSSLNPFSNKQPVSHSVNIPQKIASIPQVQPKKPFSFVSMLTKAQKATLDVARSTVRNPFKIYRRAGQLICGACGSAGAHTFCQKCGKPGARSKKAGRCNHCGNYINTVKCLNCGKIFPLK